MNATHLNEERWAALLDGRLDATEADQVANHLEEECEVCDAFLAGRTEADPLDGLVDEALVGLADTRVAPPSRPAPEEPPRPVRRRRGRLVPWATALAAAAAAVALAVLVPGRSPEEGERPWREKGPGAAALVELRIIVRTDSGIESYGRGEPQPGSVLLFQVRSSERVCVHLIETRAGRTEALTDAPLCVPGGRTVLQEGGHPLAFPVDTAGARTIWAVPVPVGSGPARIVEALSAGRIPDGAHAVRLGAEEARPATPPEERR